MTVQFIWTSKGNLDVQTLRYVPRWTITPGRVEFVEEYYLGGELVRRNVHVKLLETQNGQHRSVLHKLQERVTAGLARLRSNGGAR